MFHSKAFGSPPYKEIDTKFGDKTVTYVTGIMCYICTRAVLLLRVHKTTGYNMKIRLSELTKKIDENSLKRLILLGYLIAMVVQWKSERNIAVADSISYIVGGINLTTIGQFTNPFGEAELWFPPIYPILIGLFSLGGTIDPMYIARGLSFLAGMVTLFVLIRIGSLTVGTYLGLLSATFLLANPLFQFLSMAALSEMIAATFGLAAFVFWLTNIEEGASVKKAAFFGGLVSIACLTRPEYILLLVAWIFIDILMNRDRRSVIHGITALLVCIALLTPYVGYLYLKTGEIVLSNKSEVNIVDGQSKFHNGPRQHINPVTMEIEYSKYPDDFIIEIKRYIFNLQSIFNGYKDIYGTVFVWIYWLGAVYGVIWLWRNGYRRVALGSLAGLGYLPILAHFSVETRYLYGSIPFLTLLTATGTKAFLFDQHKLDDRLHLLRWILITFLALSLLEGYTRYPRWELTTNNTPLEFIRDAALSVRGSLDHNCIVYEWGATFGYYAGCLRGRLTEDNLGLVLRYIRNRSDSLSPYLVINLQATKHYHMSVRNLLRNNKHKGLSLSASFVEGEQKLLLYKVLKE